MCWLLLSYIWCNYSPSPPSSPSFCSTPGNSCTPQPSVLCGEGLVLSLFICLCLALPLMQHSLLVFCNTLISTRQSGIFLWSSPVSSSYIFWYTSAFILEPAFSPSLSLSIPLSLLPLNWFLSHPLWGHLHSAQHSLQPS